MYDLIHNFAAQKRKIDANLEQAADVLPNAVGGSGEPRSDEGLEVQAIVILGSPEMGLDDKPTQKNATLVESRKVSPVPTAIQWSVFPREPSASQIGPITPGPGVGGRLFLIIYCLIHISLLADQLPPWKRYQFLGRRVFRRLLIDRGPSTRANLRLIICMICTRRCYG